MKTVLVTGSNSGLGFEVAKKIATDKSWRVILACRSSSKAAKAVAAIKEKTSNPCVEFISLDLASFASIRQFSQEFVDKQPEPLHSIICNAGISKESNSDRTVDGLESTFAVNYLGHFLLVNLLLKHLATTSRIVFVSSGLHDPKTWKGASAPRYINADLVAYPERDSFRDKTDSEAGSRAYTTSKLCNVFCAYELVRRLEAEGHGKERLITCNVFNPGLMAGTGLNREGSIVSRFFWHVVLPLFRPLIAGAYTPKQSGEILAKLITDQSLEKITGKYFSVKGEEASSDESYNLEKARELWDSSARLVNLQTHETLLKIGS